MKPTALHPRRSLVRILGVGFGLAVIIGNTIGAGILRTPGEVAARLPNPWMFIGIWIAGGVYALLGAVSIAELGVLIPRSGGQYVFARRALGDYAGFVVGWSDWLSTCGTAAAVSIVVGEYSEILFPVLTGRRVPIAVVTVVVFTLLQWKGLRWGSATQNVASLLKALAFLGLIITAFILGPSRPDSSGTVVVSAPTGQLIAIILALQAVIYTYDGWTGVIYFSEEVQDPARNVPRAMIGGVFSIIAIYVLFNLAMIYVVPVTQLAGKTLAAGTVAVALFGARGDTVIRAITILSMLGGINAYQLMSSRVLYAMSCDGLFFRRGMEVNEGGTPSVALFTSAAIAIAFILSGTFEKVMALLAFFFVANYTLSFVSVFVLRNKEPEKPRAYRAWGYPWSTGLALIISVAFLIGAAAGDTQNSIESLVLLAASYPTFRWIKHRLTVSP